MRSLHRYHRLLIELGERDYSSLGDSFSVEVRLGFMVLVNCIIFLIAKKIYQIKGKDVSEDFFRLYNNLGNETIEVGTVSGLEEQEDEGNSGGGLMNMFGGLAGLFGGGGDSGGGGLSSLFSMFGGMGGNLGNTTAGNNTGTQSPQTETENTGENGESRIPIPKHRRKKKKKKPVIEEEMS